MITARFELVEVECEPPPVVRLHGEVDASNAFELDRLMGERAAARAPWILDLSAVTYFDSAGFEVLDRAPATGVLSVVVSPSSVVRMAATLMGVPLHDTIEDARRALPTTAE